MATEQVNQKWVKEVSVVHSTDYGHGAGVSDPVMIPENVHPVSVMAIPAAGTSKVQYTFDTALKVAGAEPSTAQWFDWTPGAAAAAAQESFGDKVITALRFIQATGGPGRFVVSGQKIA